MAKKKENLLSMHSLSLLLHLECLFIFMSKNACARYSIKIYIVPLKLSFGLYLKNLTDLSPTLKNQMSTKNRLESKNVTETRKVFN